MSFFRKFIIVAAVASTGALGNAVPVSTDEVTQLVQTESKSVAQYWNLTPMFRIKEGKKLEIDNAGVIEYGRSRVQDVLAKVPDDQRKFVVRWIVAHETWHQVQRRNDGPPPEDDNVARRTLECTADVMASIYMADTFIRESLVPDLAKRVSSLGVAVKNVISELQDAEKGYGGNFDHPSAAQRRRAITLGGNRGIIPHLKLIDQLDEREAATLQMQRMLDYKEAEAPEDWALRTCGMIQHSGNGSGDITELTRNVNFNKNGDPPVVDFELPYKNVGTLPVHVEMKVMTLAVPRVSPEDADSWLMVDSANYLFDLAPGQQYTITGRLYWIANDDSFPRLLMPLSRESFFNATRDEKYQPVANKISDRKLSPRLRNMALKLLTIANAATDQFQSLRGQPCRNTRRERVCPLNIQFPSANSAEIESEANGAVSVELEFYDGKNLHDARRIYSELKRDLKEIDPFKIYRESDEDATHVTLTFSPNPYSKFTLRMMTLSSGTIHVIASIVPERFSDD